MMLPLKRAAVLLSVLAIVLVGLILDRFLNGDASAPGSSQVAAPLPSVAMRPTAAATVAPERTFGGVPLATCAANDLAFAASGWQGATGSMAGSATVINVSPEPCRIAGKPSVALFARRGDAISTGGPAEPGRGDEGVELSEGDVVSVTTVWSNWCGGPPTRPLSLRISLPGGGGDLEAIVREDRGSRTGAPRCDTRGAPSTIGVPNDFAAPSRREPTIEPPACRAGALDGFLGPWGAGLGNYYASVFLLNAGGIDCLLATSPALELRDAAGKGLARAERSNTSATIVLPAAWVAVARIDFANWCLAEPKLPFEFQLTIGSAPLKLTRATANSEIGPPSCISPGATPPPVLGYESPFDVPALSTP